MEGKFITGLYAVGWLLVIYLTILFGGLLIKDTIDHIIKKRRR